MLTVTPVKSAGQALHYFSKDNYYTQDEGLEHSEWFGKGAATLGLSGKIEQEDFFAMLNGYVAGQELGKIVENKETGEKEREHRPGTDLTFSAPKSVSLLAEVGGFQAVRQAHENAVKKALEYVESELVQTRIMVEGQVVPVQTGNLVVAMFRNNTSRDLDPQTHTHANAMNATQGGDEKWRSVWNDAFYKAQLVVGAVYNAELASGLQNLGLDLRRTDEKGNFEVSGISREQIEHFSQRRTEIASALKARGVDIDEAGAQLKEDAALLTRDRKKEVDHVQLIAEWKARAEAQGVNFDQIWKDAQASMEKGVMREDRLTGRQAMEFAAAHLIEREAVVSKEDLLQVAIAHGTGRVSPKDVMKAFEKLEEQGHLVKLPDGNYTTAKMLGSEKWAVDQVKAEQGTTVAMMDAERVGAAINVLERKQGFTFTAGQREALSMAVTTQDRYVAIQGLAGTGKTTMLKAFRKMAQDQGYVVRGMAPTGAAAKVLARETGIAAETVAMFQIKERQLQKDIEFAKQYSPEFQRKTEVWVVDESSFTSQRQKAQLDYMAAKAGAKVVYLGDSLQLQGVEAGKPFELAQKEGQIQTAYMTEISRQKGEDVKEAVGIIVGRDKLEPGQRLTEVELTENTRAFNYLVEKGHVKETEDLVGSVVKDVLSKTQEQREHTIVITAYNKDRKAINEGVRAGLKEQGLVSRDEQTKEVFVSKGWTRAMMKESQYYKDGDVVRFGRDYQKMGVGKGEYARVISGDASGTGGVVLRREKTGETLYWEPKKNNNAEVYNSETRGVSKGDVIRLTRNEGIFKNGEVATVAAVQGEQVVLAVKVGNDISLHEISLGTNKHWDHAYVSTVHASQGTTKQEATLAIRPPSDENEKKEALAMGRMAKVFGDRAFYVGVTRASQKITIYTTDKDVAAKAVGVKQDKTSALQTINKAQELEKIKSVGVDR